MRTIFLLLSFSFSVSSFASDQYCGYEKAETKMISNKDLLVLCPHSESFSIIDTQNNSAEKYLNQVGFENRNIIFDQEETGFVSFNYDNSFVTEIRWFDLTERKFGPVIKLSRKLDLRSVYAKSRVNIHLFKNNEQVMATLVGMPSGYSNEFDNEIVIETLDLKTGSTIANKSVMEKNHISASDCGRVVSGSDVAKINGTSYLISKNSNYYAKGCSAVKLEWDGSDNTQFALIDPIRLTAIKKFSIPTRVLSKDDYGFTDVISVDDHNYLLSRQVTQDGKSVLGVNLESGEVVAIPRK